MHTPGIGAACAVAGLTVVTVRAEAQQLNPVVVTATRIPEPAERIPASISVVSGAEVDSRNVTDMSSAMALVPGVEAPAGGDAGPSSAVPSFWGLHEFDAFLLVVDGVPWGGAFNPAITTLNFTDTQRVEVLKGAAPVMYGATSFVGVVQVIHYPAGEAANNADVAIGNFGSIRGAASLALPQVSDFRQSLSLDGQNMGFSDGREAITNGNALYRSSLDIGSGTLRLDADVSYVRDVPTSPVLRIGSTLSPLTPVDANFNPADSRINENEYHVAVGYSQPTAFGSWETLLSYAYSRITDVRAFLHPDSSGTADTQSQDRHIDDAYVDTHLSHSISSDAVLLVGADFLYGRGRQTTRNGNDAYTVPLDGSQVPPPAAIIPVDEIGTLDDKRHFSGQYAQLDWKLGDRWDVLSGLRLNEAYEHKDSSDLTFSPTDLESQSIGKTVVRATETVGVSYRAWHRDADHAVIYAGFRNAFKPAAIDFGPDYTPDLLNPETAQSYEVGFKGVAAAGRLTYQTEIFLMNFSNLVVATESGALANAAGERLRGIEGEARYSLTPELSLAASTSYHNATFSNYLFFDGTSSVQVAGRQLPLSPRVLLAAGILYTPRRGFTTTVIGRYTGKRFLDEENTAQVGGYTTLEAQIGYARDWLRVTLDGTNLTNQRPPVTASEFGSESFYLLPGRMIWLRLDYSWR